MSTLAPSNSRSRGTRVAGTIAPARGRQSRPDSLRTHLQDFVQLQAITEIALDGSIISANETFCNLLGLDRSEVEGQPLSQFVNAKFRDSAEYKALWDRVRKGEQYTGAHRYVGSEDSVVWLQVSCTAAVTSEGVNCILQVGSDITTTMLRLEEVSAELKVRTDIMNVTSIVSEADKKGDILSINEKYIEVSKFNRAELIGSPHSITRHPDMPSAVFKQMWSTIGRGELFRGKIKNRAKDGTPYYVDAVVAPILGENGKPMKYLGVRYDITDAEIERQNASGILAAIDASFAYVEFDLAGNVQHANENFLRVMGYAAADVTGKHHRTFVDPAESAKPSYAKFWADLASGQSHNDVFRRIASSGDEVWIQAIYAPVKDEMGRVFKVVKIAVDVTAQKRAEVDLRNKVAEMLIVVNAAAEGDLTKEVRIEGADPIGQMGEGLRRFLSDLRSSVHTMGGTASALAAAAEELSTVASQMNGNASDTSSQASVVSAASEEVSSNVSTVATATEEMGASIREISSNVTQAASVAAHA
ncbi:MAG: PAS domain S-box protein, partial [Gemmatimonas sp.]